MRLKIKIAEISNDGYLCLKKKWINAVEVANLYVQQHPERRLSWRDEHGREIIHGFIRKKHRRALHWQLGILQPIPSRSLSTCLRFR